MSVTEDYSSVGYSLNRSNNLENKASVLSVANKVIHDTSLTSVPLSFPSHSNKMEVHEASHTPVLGRS